MSKNQNKQAIFGGFRNQVGLQFFAGKNRMTEIEERLAAISTQRKAEKAHARYRAQFERTMGEITRLQNEE